MKVLIFGSNGYLGRQFAKLYPEAICPKADIADQASVSRILDAEKPDVVINAAGKTGRPNVDWCEDHKMETMRSNVTGPLVLLEECAKRNIYWVHLGSGCIYQGDNGGKGFGEEDMPNYMGSFYSRTKAWSDQMLKEFPVLNLRLRMPFDGTANERNLFMKLRKYNRVLDVRNSITCLPDFLDAAVQLIEHRETGTFNMVNPGSISPYEAMEMYKEIVDSSHAFEHLSLQELSEVVKAGRSNCILSIEKLQKHGIHMRPVKEAVQSSLLELKTELS